MKRRQRNYNSFVDDWFYEIEEKYKIEIHDNDGFSIYTDRFGIVDYYPKSNKLLLRKDNKWINLGIEWIKENLL